MKTLPNFILDEHNPADPSPWLALYLDQSSPLSDAIKQAWLTDSASRSRQFLMPIVRPLARACIVVFQLIKALLPKRWQAPMVLHWLLAEGLKRWVSPQANWMILRHFHLGSDILAFIGGNAGVTIPSRPLRPMVLDDLKDNLFVQHDLNLFNFVIYLNKALAEQGRSVETLPRLDLSMVKPCPVRLEDMPTGKTNFIDLQTAIEIFTPVYQLLLTDNDFWRACNSLQLDETIGIYAARITGMPEHLVMLNNRHPLVPESTLRAGFRLVLHGLSTEMLHSLLLQLKARQAAEDGVNNPGAPASAWA
jgi:hypothetical protein